MHAGSIPAVASNSAYNARLHLLGSGSSQFTGANMVASNIPPVRLRSWCIRKGLRWSIISAFMKTRISQVSATIPFVGYALLWSEEIKKYLELQVALHGGLWF